MNLKQLLTELMTKLNEDNSASNENRPWLKNNSLPIFSTSANGYTVFFSNESLDAIRNIAKIFFEENTTISSVTEIENFQKILRQVVTDLYAENQLSINTDEDCREAIKKLKEKSKEVVAELQKEFVHYFPAWTINLMDTKPFVFGAVTLTRHQWIESVNLHQQLIERYLSKPEENKLWKENIKKALETKPLPDRAEGDLADDFYKTIKDAPAVLKIKVLGYEKELSRKVGQIVCKSTLDAISLLLGRPEFFSTQTLQIERALPHSFHTLVETDGYLWLPGSGRTKRFQVINNQDALKVIDENAEVVSAFEKILSALLNPSGEDHPELCKRWTTALDWYAEGCREQNSSIAVAKIGTSLDVLACGGKFKGILELVSHILKCGEDEIIVKGDLNWSLKKLIKEIYDNGRSQILHGTHYDRLKSFEQLNVLAIQITRFVLIEAAFRLNKYTGTDNEKAFLTM
jgi:hypothetical protein